MAPELLTRRELTAKPRRIHLNALDLQPEQGAGEDVVHGGKGDRLRRQQQQSREDRRLNRYARGLK